MKYSLQVCFIQAGIVVLLLFFPAPAVFSEKTTAAVPADGTEFDEQDLLFLLEESYTQEQFETQVTIGFQILKGRFKEQEFEDDFDTVETKGQRKQTLSMPLAVEFGITDWWEVELETEYEQVRTNTWEINAAGTRKTQDEDDFGDLEIGTSLRLIHEKDHAPLPTVTVGMSVVLPTSDFKEQELAEKRTGFEWVLKASKLWNPDRIPGDVTTHFNVGFGISPRAQGLNEGLENSKPHDLREFNYGFAAVWRFTEHLSLFAELAHEIEEEIELNRRVSESELVFLPGASVRGDLEEEFEWELAGGFPIGLTADAGDWGFALQLKLEA